MPTSAAILSTKTRLNPSKPQANEYHENSDCDYVLLKRGATKPIIVSSCGPLRNFELGSWQPCHADQSCRFMGDFKVIGIINWAEDEESAYVGEIPTKACRYYVFK